LLLCGPFRFDHFLFAAFFLVFFAAGGSAASRASRSARRRFAIVTEGFLDGLEVSHGHLGLDLPKRFSSFALFLRHWFDWFVFAGMF
jgi:hypothetical protein